MSSNQGSDKLSSRPRAAQYIRMSTDRQVYSPEGQAAAIAVYAISHNIDVVRTYRDEGRSGLSLNGRDGLKQLLADVQSGLADFDLILVYDVSRWGRFQDIDESAHHEFLCKQAGKKVIYCAEQFENDDSPASVLVKALKRMMAGEYSRELSVRIRDAQHRLAAKGFRQGGPAGIGLRRMMVDREGQPKGLIPIGERKTYQSDRVVLVPGPKEEVDVVRFMFHALVKRHFTTRDIADHLNAKGAPTPSERPWNAKSVRNILSNPKYAGHNRRGFFPRDIGRGGKRKRVDPTTCTLIRDTFEPLVSPKVFDQAQALLADHRPRYSTERIVDQLRQLLTARGTLSLKIIKEAKGIVGASTVSHRFGSLAPVYKTLGYTPARNPEYLVTRTRLREIKDKLLTEVVEGLKGMGLVVHVLCAKDALLLANNRIVIGSTVARRQISPSKTLRWRALFQAHRAFNVALIRLVDEPMQQVIADYAFTGLDTKRFEKNLYAATISKFDAERLESVSQFCSLIADLMAAVKTPRLAMGRMVW